jgi:hypothetical protein
LLALAAVCVFYRKFSEFMEWFLTSKFLW